MDNKKNKASSSQRRAGKKKSNKRSQLQVQASIPGMGSGSVNWGSQQVAPLSKTRNVRTGEPRIRSLPGGTSQVSHREFITDVAGSVNFVITKLPINPGLEAVFKWLSGIAPNYENYLFLDLRFLYETQKSCSTDGSVMMAIDYDAADDAPADKQDLMSLKGAVRGSVWSAFSFNASSMDLKKFTTQRFVRVGALTENQDIKTYDVGNLFLATQGMVDGSKIGELYVEYTVRLITPHPSAFAQQLDANFWYATFARISDVATWFKNDSDRALGNLPVKILTDLNSFSIRPPGIYRCYFYLSGPNAGVSGGISLSSSTATTTEIRTVAIVGVSSTDIETVWDVTTSLENERIDITSDILGTEVMLRETEMYALNFTDSLSSLFRSGRFSSNSRRAEVIDVTQIMSTERSKRRNEVTLSTLQGSYDLCTSFTRDAQQCSTVSNRVNPTSLENTSVPGVCFQPGGGERCGEQEPTGAKGPDCFPNNEEGSQNPSLSEMCERLENLKQMIQGLDPSARHKAVDAQ